MYHERHGRGVPLLMLNGAFGTIESDRVEWVSSMIMSFLTRPQGLTGAASRH